MCLKTEYLDDACSASWWHINTEDQTLRRPASLWECSNPVVLIHPNQQGCRGRRHLVLIARSMVSLLFYDYWRDAPWSFQGQSSSSFSAYLLIYGPNFNLNLDRLMDMIPTLPSELQFSGSVCIPTYDSVFNLNLQIVTPALSQVLCLTLALILWLEVAPWVLTTALPLTPINNHI